jgi:hypothetical protein
LPGIAKTSGSSGRTPHAVFRWTVTVDGRKRVAVSLVAVLRHVREALDPGYAAIRVRIAVAPLCRRDE